MTARFPRRLRAGRKQREQPAAPATIMKIQDVKQSGTCGNTVTANTRYGLVRRRRPVRSKRSTEAQVRPRDVFSRISARWRTLTDDQRQAWNGTGLKATSRPRGGQSGPLSGFALFMKINCALAAAGVGIVTLPPKPAKARPNPVGRLSITNRRGEITLLLSVPKPPAELTLVLASPPCSAGRSSSNGYAIIGLLPAAVHGVSDITDLYFKKYGKAPARSRIFIRTRQLINGWQDDPKDTDAVVPPE
jgi:hypothetical protein